MNLDRLPQLVHACQLARQRQRGGGSYRFVVSFGRYHQINAEVYRSYLDQAKLHRSHVCRIISILNEAEVAAQFVRGDCTFHQAYALARGKAAAPRRKRQPAPSPSLTRLQALGKALVREHPDLQPGLYACGLFTLELRPKTSARQIPETVSPPAAPTPRLKIRISPATADTLDRLAARSGLNRSETAGELLRRMPWPELLNIFPHPPLRGEFPETDATARGLQRRIHPGRSSSGWLPVDVVLPVETRADLLDLAQRSGLRPGAAANLLLEPGAIRQLQQIDTSRAALAHDRATEPPRPDLSQPSH